MGAGCVLRPGGLPPVNADNDAGRLFRPENRIAPRPLRIRIQAGGYSAPPACTAYFVTQVPVAAAVRYALMNPSRSPSMTAPMLLVS